MIPVYDPDNPDDDPRYKLVSCSRCRRRYQCRPADDWIDPAPDLGWTAGRVCESCLLVLSGLQDIRTLYTR